jgi:hypothetical protein
MTSYKLCGYNTGCYSSAQDAAKFGALYRTSSTVDALEDNTGIYDLMDVCNMFKGLSGDDDFEFGILLNSGLWVSFDILSQALQKCQSGSVLSDLEEVQDNDND